MTSIVQDIQAIRSLRNDLSVGSEVRLPNNIIISIDSILNCIKSGTDLNGWKKVEWRNTPTSSSTGSSQREYGSGSNRYGPSSGPGYNRGGNTFFNGRQSNDRQSNDRQSNDRQSNDRHDSSSQYTFGNRNKNGSIEHNKSEVQSSIPLTNTTIITSSNAPIISPDGFRTVSQKYVSKFKKNSEKVEDTILNTILLGKLNKFSELNYTEIKEFVTHIIDGGQTEMIKCFMKIVFEKAASEEVFCPLYAKLLSELSSSYPVLLTEMTNLYSVYMAIFEEVPENKADNYNEVCKQNIEKKYRRGYSQFLAELIKYNVIDNDLFMKTVTTIISQIEYNLKIKESSKLIEEYADCLVKVMKAIQYDNSSKDNKENMIQVIRQTLKTTMIGRIKPLSMRNDESIGLSNKARFTFLDIYEGIQKF
jgi:hypothetical protein